MMFQDILAQDQAILILRKALRGGKVPHAYLFSGPPGIGKHLTARSLAMALNCEESEDDACGSCTSCRKILRNTHPDVLEISIPASKKAIPVETIRDLESRFALRPNEGRAKVAIVDPADLMTTAAANAVLKTLEEPRPARYLILITSRSASLLSTVRSRCQLIRFRSLPPTTISTLLKRQGISEELASTIADLCQGSLEQATLYLHDNLESRIDQTITLLESATLPTPEQGLKVVQELGGDRNDTLALLDLILVVLAEALWVSTHPTTTDRLSLARQTGERLVHLACRLPIGRITSYIAATHLAMERIRQNNLNPGLALEGILLAMRGRTDDGSVESAFGVL